jgi:hypothetical protein
MRKFAYITAGVILNRLKDEGINISRVTFYKLEKSGLFASQRAAGEHGWRVFSPEDVEIIIKLVKENYKIK